MARVEREGWGAGAGYHMWSGVTLGDGDCGAESNNEWGVAILRSRQPRRESRQWEDRNLNFTKNLFEPSIAKWPNIIRILRSGSEVPGQCTSPISVSCVCEL